MSGSRPRSAASTCATTARRAIAHAVGRSYPDLVRIRAGDASSAPDAVVLPASAEQVAAVLAACAEQRVAVVPVRRRHERGRRRGAGARRHARPSISLDLGRLAAHRGGRPHARSPRGSTPACSAPRPSAGSREQGVTLGHFPQSFEYSTVGGWVATRSAGQASTGYGRIDELVEAVRCVTPGRGARHARRARLGRRARACASSCVGSEGMLGVICEATAARARRAGGAPLRGLVVLRSFAEGCDAFRVHGAGRRLAPT